MMIKKIKFLMIMAIVLCALPCAPVTVTITNDADDMIRSNRIWVRIGLAANESGVLKNSLQFSTDCSAMTLKSWHPLIEPTSVYVEAFKKRKRLLVGPFAGWLASDYHASAQQLKEELSLIYVSGFVVRTDGSVGPFMCSCSLARHAPVASEPLVMPKVVTMPSSSYVQPKTQNLEQEFVALENSQRQWERLCNSFAAAPLAKIFLWFNVIAWLCWLIGALFYYHRWRFIPTPRWARRDQRLDEAFYFLMMLNLITAIGIWLSLRWAIALAALGCGVIFVYVLMVPGQEASLWGRFKNLIGTTCGISVVPLVIKTILLFYGIG